MNRTRQFDNDDLPLAITLLATSCGKVACVLTNSFIFGVGSGEDAELDVVAKFGTELNTATLYSSRMPDNSVMKFLEKCGLRRLVVAQSPPPGHNPGTSRNFLLVEYADGVMYRLRDMVRSLEREVSI